MLLSLLLFNAKYPGWIIYYIEITFIGRKKRMGNCNLYLIWWLLHRYWPILVVHETTVKLRYSLRTFYACTGYVITVQVCFDRKLKSSVFSVTKPNNFAWWQFCCVLNCSETIYWKRNAHKNKTRWFPIVFHSVRRE